MGPEHLRTDKPMVQQVRYKEVLQKGWCGQVKVRKK